MLLIVYTNYDYNNINEIPQVYNKFSYLKQKSVLLFVFTIPTRVYLGSICYVTLSTFVFKLKLK